jgi:two-component system, LytTR family, sensor kinase
MPAQRKSLSLRSAVDVDVLQRIQDTFATAMGVAAVTVDQTGKPITRESNFLRICRMIRSTDTGLARCMQCDAEGGLGARKLGGPHSYTCHGGMRDIAAPIIIKGEYLGCILCGQVVPAETRDELLGDILERNLRLGLPLPDLKKAVSEIPSLPRERINAAGEMLFQMSNYIVEVGVANLTQAELLHQMEERAALQAALQNAQLRTLEAQINPHFLFNALGLISYTAMEENASRTEEIAYSLSDLLRYGLRNVAAVVTLSQEIEAIQRYLGIQQLRFGSRLIVRIDVDPSLQHVRMPCMILQPLVENAVVHAVEPLARPVTVQVRASRVPGGMLLEVSDDGVGMDSRLVQAIREHSPILKPGRTTIGLGNVMQRLELEYGGACQVSVVSQPGHGTRLTLRLPVTGVPGAPVEDLRVGIKGN